MYSPPGKRPENQYSIAARQKVCQGYPAIARAHSQNQPHRSKGNKGRGLRRPIHAGHAWIQTAAPFRPTLEPAYRLKAVQACGRHDGFPAAMAHSTGRHRPMIHQPISERDYRQATPDLPYLQGRGNQAWESLPPKLHHHIHPSVKKPLENKSAKKNY